MGRLIGNTESFGIVKVYYLLFTTYFQYKLGYLEFNMLNRL